jgi:hypothetical protein
MGRDHVVRGRVTFEARYSVFGRAPPADSGIPVGSAGVPLLRVCLYERAGRQDPKRDATIVDDEQLGCRDTGPDGSFEFRVPAARCRPGADCSRRVYFLTSLCAWASGIPQACVAANTVQGEAVRGAGFATAADHRKLLWSRVYALEPEHRTSTLLNWNLTCPTQSGEGIREVRCEGRRRWGRFDRAGSNYGFDDAAVHAYVAAARVVSVHGSLVPSPETVARSARACGSTGDPARDAWQCRDAVRVILRDLRRPFWEGKRHCGRSEWENFYLPMRSVCIGDPYHPFAVPHELGHLVHARWMGYWGPMNGGPVGWRSGAAQKSQVGEGWADFFAAATWFSPEARHPNVSGFDQESSRAVACSNGVAQGELAAAHFFWDLWDVADPAEPADQVQVDMRTLLRVWSAFGGSATREERRDRARGECRPDGRNVADFLYHWERHTPALPDARALVELDCLESHAPGLGCR